MNVQSIGRMIREQVTSAVVTVPDRTGHHDTARDNLVMTRAYLLDGDSFLSTGDAVNALAAYSYGLGWLHCGAALGLFVVQDTSCPLVVQMEQLPSSLSEKLTEKAHWYERLLDTAAAAVTPAAEKGTIPYTSADRVMLIIAFYAGRGNTCLSLGRRGDALACFSYGHGWLDAGVRAGLFSVHASRDLFTI